jgi:thiol:disulfide interchange protein DsbC
MNSLLPPPRTAFLAFAAALGILAAGAVAAQTKAAPNPGVKPSVADDSQVEAAIRKGVAERLPQFPPIDEVRRTPIPGLYELRFGNDIFYADAEGNHLIQGELIDLRTRANLTEERVAKLTAIDFAKLPFKDAVAIKQGSGARKLAVFVDPNCGYCKRFERDVAALKDVTVYTFLYPILGPDSAVKSRDIWCAKDPAKAWRDWMLDGVPAPAAPQKCDVAAIDRNVDLGKKHRVQGTPASVFEDGTRIPGAVPGDRLEKQLAASSKRG